MTKPMAQLEELITNLKDQEDAEGRKVRTRTRKAGGYMVYFPSGTVQVFTASTDPNAEKAQRALVRREGFHWPGDPVPKERTPRKVTPKVETPEPQPAVPALPHNTEIVEVTPEIAARWLESNRRNRKLSDAAVSKYAEFMRKGHWHFDASPIKFDENNDVIDGQHRLWAIVESETTQTFLVVRGLPPEVFAVMDTGKTRSFADILSIEFPGKTQYVKLAATTSLFYRWDNGARGSLLATHGRTSRFRGVSNDELLAYFRAHEDDIVEYTRLGDTVRYKVRGATSTAFALAMRVMDHIDTDDSEFFFERLKDGVGLDAGHPILALRNAFSKFATNGDRRAGIPSDLALALIFKAWNAFRQGRQVQVLTFRGGGASPETYPEPE